MKPYLRHSAWVFCAVCLIMMSTAPAWADAPRTPFTGKETITGGLAPTIIPAGSKFHVLITQVGMEEASDARVSGTSTIVANAIWELPLMIGPMWGTLKVVNAEGEWNAYWQGSRTLTEEGDVITSIVTTGIGSGAYEGLIARWNIRGLNVGESNPYLYYDGFIVEATKGHVALPMTWRATRTESLSLDTLQVDIVSETGRGTHIGHAANAGIGFLVPIDQTAADITGMGYLTAPNGDLLYWVVEGLADLTGKNGATVSLHFTGGTGRFEFAVGQMDGTIFAPFGPPDNNNVISATFDYTASGSIRY